LEFGVYKIPTKLARIEGQQEVKSGSEIHGLFILASRG